MPRQKTKIPTLKKENTITVKYVQTKNGLTTNRTKLQRNKKKELMQGSGAIWSAKKGIVRNYKG